MSRIWWNIQTNWVCRKVGYPKKISGLSQLSYLSRAILGYPLSPNIWQQWIEKKSPMFGQHPYVPIGCTWIFPRISPYKAWLYQVWSIEIPILVTPNMAQTSARRSPFPTFPQHSAVRVAAIGEVSTLGKLDAHGGIAWGLIDFHMEICILCECACGIYIYICIHILYTYMYNIYIYIYMYTHIIYICVLYIYKCTKTRDNGDVVMKV